MRKTTLVAVAVMVLIAAHAVVMTQEERSLSGEYVWGKRGKGGELRALFRAKGNDRWDVAFYFRYREQNHVYRGTAEGKLGAGTLKGEVLSDDLSRTFTFEGAFENGTFKGTHAEVKKRGPQSTGTLTLRP